MINYLIIFIVMLRLESDWRVALYNVNLQTAIDGEISAIGAGGRVADWIERSL